MMAKCQFPDASAEVERLRVELEHARKAGDSYFHQAMENGNAAQNLRVENERLRADLLAEEKETDRLRQILVSGGRGDWRDKLADWISGGLVSYWYRRYVECAQELDFLVDQNGKACVRAENAEDRADRLQAERDDLAARLQAIQQADRDLTRAKLDTAKAMRKGEAI